MSALGIETLEDKANMELTRQGYGRVAVQQRDNLRKYEAEVAETEGRRQAIATANSYQDVGRRELPLQP
eukprot:SAG31_NODE_9464_length_1273_cov_1.391823_2_plen_69_part_00